MSRTIEQLVDPAHTALIVVDVQNDFTEPAGICGKAGNDISAVPGMMDSLLPLIADARKAGVFIVFLRTIYDDPVLSRALTEQYGRQSFQNLCITGSWGAAFTDGIDPQDVPSEVIVTKNRYSAFWGSDIDLVLRAHGIETVVMTGVATEVCVESTARDAFFRDYFIVEAAECVGSYSPQRDAASKVVLQRSFAKIAPSAEIRSYWAKAKPGPRNWQEAVRHSKELATLEERLDPAHTALVLVDMQNDFCHEKGAALSQGGGTSMILETVPRIRKLLDEARAAGTMVLHVKSECGRPYRNIGSPRRFADKNVPDGAVGTLSAASLAKSSDLAEATEICIPGTWGAEFVEGLGPVDDEQVVVKHRFSGFVETRLELLLRAKEIRTVVIAGVTTNVCVESTARDAAMRDYYLVVAEDGTAVRDRHRALHDASLESLRTYFGRVEPIKRIVDTLHSHNKAMRATA